MSDSTDNIFPSDPLPEPAKRTRAKDESPMARAKVAATKLRELDTSKGKLLLAIDRYRAKVDAQDAERAAFVLTLDDTVIGILKAGGSL
jgi:hypothetical protein